MKLENIGFYTLSDQRAKNVNLQQPLQRCEMVLTDRCNFKCKYCRGLRDDIKGSMDFDLANYILDLWFEENIQNVRFSGGEPLLYKGLPALVRRCKYNNVKRIAVSTNGSLPFNRYEDLLNAGVNDFSVSLDGACCAVGDKMAGNVKGAFYKVIDNIRRLSELTYVSVGVVFTEDNIDQCVEIVKFADSLGVSDIRVIPSAQFNEALIKLSELPDSFLNKYPILKYRINNVRSNRHVRGIQPKDFKKCPLVLDDMAVCSGKHFPCIIYMREQGDYIGNVGPNMRQERYEWFLRHNSYNDQICQKNCLDVCIDYNNKCCETNPFVLSSIILGI